jgi:predicted permease
VLAFVTGLSLVTGIVFGAAPAWFSTRTDPIDALRGSGRSIGHPSSRARTALLIVQATLSVMLIAGSTMLAQSLGNLEHQDFGYRVQGRVLIGLGRLPATYTMERLSSLYRDVERRLAEIPGVRGTGLALYNPLTGTGTETILVAGHPPNPSDESGASRDSVSTDYLQNLGITLVRGRMFTAADNEKAAPVAIVNESFVKRFFRSNEDPLDQYFGIERPENAGTYRIVGIVHDAKFAFYQGLTRPTRPMFFVPLAQYVDYKGDQGKRGMLEELSHFIQSMMLVTDSAPGDLEPLLRKTLAEADPNLTITNVRTMQQQIDLSLNQQRAVARLAQLFGMLALVLAAVGVYGVTAWMVARQTNEIGVRMALGADPVGVIRLVLLRAFQRVAAGLVVGLPCAVLAARFMATQLYGVSFWDPFALTLAAVSLAGCTLLASIIPAARAAAISPMSALRSE